jgi:hypothetical protein
MMKNKSNFKPKAKFNVRQGQEIRRHEPRRRFPCLCCQYVKPVHLGVVLTSSKGKKVEVCNDCLDTADVGSITHCHNCDHRNDGQGAILRSESSLRQFCNECLDSKQSITQFYDAPRSDSESVF